ncbi:MAG: hypothetical protein NTX79_01510 [Candidatus Micrarchaeota archaeon]|nr:hypothetical protein [Candidatus Micrarchaeota archaeon]
MKLIRQFQENRAKLRHAQARALEILPLCEQATGLKLGSDRPLKVEALSKWKIRFRLFCCALSDIRDARESGEVYDTRLTLFFAALEAADCSRASGLNFMTKGMITSIQLADYQPGTADGDYMLMHEITHGLFAQEGGQNPINSNNTLCEGAATFYGEKAARMIHPEFDVSGQAHFKGVYKTGYGFFAAVAASLPDPISAISLMPPGECRVNCTYLGVERSFSQDEMDYPDKYVERVTAPKASSRRPIDFEADPGMVHSCLWQKKDRNPASTYLFP